MLYTLPQQPRCIQLADLQWHAGPVQAGWCTAAPVEEDHLPPGLQSDDLWLWHCTAGARWAAGVHQHHPTHLPTLSLPHLPCGHVLLGHRLGRSPRRRYYAGIGDFVWSCGLFFFFFFSFFLFFLSVVVSHSRWLLYSLNNFAAIPQLTMTHSPIVLFLFAYPAHIKIKTSHSSPIPLTISYSSPSFIFFSLPASFFSPSSLSFRPVFSLSFNVPPISLSLPSWHTSLPLSPPSLFSHLFLICSIPLSLLLYPYIKADVGSPGKPLKPSLANTNPAH